MFAHRATPRPARSCRPVRPPVGRRVRSRGRARERKETRMATFQEFKKFVLRGSVIDLAVGVVIGAAFTAVVTNLVAGFITPLIAAIVGKKDFSKLHWTSPALPSLSAFSVRIS